MTSQFDGYVESISRGLGGSRMEIGTICILRDPFHLSSSIFNNWVISRLSVEFKVVVALSTIECFKLCYLQIFAERVVCQRNHLLLTE